MVERIEKKGKFVVTGIVTELVNEVGGENKSAIMDVWASVSSEQLHELMSVSNHAVAGLLGVSDERDGTTFNYLIGTTTDQVASDSLVEFPELEWLIFESVGALPDAMWQVKKQAKQAVLISGFKQADYSRIEVYPEGDMSSETYKSELWIPVVTKNLRSDENEAILKS